MSNKDINSLDDIHTGHNDSMVPRSLARNAHDIIMKGLHSSVLVGVPKHLKSLVTLLHGPSNTKRAVSPIPNEIPSSESQIYSQKKQKQQRKLQTKNIQIVTRNDLLLNKYDLAGSSTPTSSKSSTSHHSHSKHKHKHKHHGKSLLHGTSKSKSVPVSPIDSQSEGLTLPRLSVQIDDLDLTNELYIPARDQIRSPLNALAENGDYLSIPLQKSLTKESKISDSLYIST